VEVAFRRRLPRVISLEELRNARALADLPVLRRGNRLSVTPVTPAEWQAILGLL
jgi:predicted RNA-binding protein with PUA-like domain